MPIQFLSTFSIMLKALAFFRVIKRWCRDIATNGADLLGLVQLKLGREPVFIRTPRMALEQWKLHTKRNTLPAKKIAIVAFRNFTWVEWAVFAAHYLLNKGYAPILIYSQVEINSLYPKKRFLEKIGFHFWDEVLKLNYIEKIKLEDHLDNSDGLENYYLKFAEDFAPTLAAYNLKVEEFEEDVEAQQYQSELKESRKILISYGAAIERALKTLKFDRLICPSGLIGLSVAYLEVAKRLNIKAVFVEAWAMRPGHMLWAFGQPALIYDIQGWMKVIGVWDETKERDSRDFFKFQERERVVREDWLENFHPVQRSKKGNNFPKPLEEFLKVKGRVFLLGTNVVGDSSILRRPGPFKNQKEWLKEVIDFFTKEKGCRLLIRAHPDEVWARAKAKIGSYAYQFAKDIPNIFVIKGDEDVNTYSLIQYADVGLAWTSNIGLDMVLRGKPVLVAASPKYDNLGIAYRPKTRPEYFKKILEYAQNPPKPSADVIQKAKIYQRIIFKEMSLQAASQDYRSSGYRLGKGRMHKEQEKFFKILVGELDEKGRPWQ